MLRKYNDTLRYSIVYPLVTKGENSHIPEIRNENKALRTVFHFAIGLSQSPGAPVNCPIMDS